MRSQMRATAALVLLKLSTGVTPVRLLKIETSRSAGHALASSTSSFWLLKLSKGVAVAAAASSWLENATISFVSLVGKVVIIVGLFATRWGVQGQRDRGHRGARGGTGTRRRRGEEDQVKD